jgi:hypothetical protein
VVSDTTTRVPQNTGEEVNRQIDEEMRERLYYFAANPDEIDGRLRDLDEEWNVERALEANAATAALTGLVLGTAANRRWYALPAVVAVFLLQHAVQGWCPPLPVLRRLGYRTPHEIETERMALKALRGDFDRLDRGSDERRARSSRRAARL